MDTLIFISGIILGISTNSIIKGMVAAIIYIFGMGWAVSAFGAFVNPFLIVAIGFLIALFFINSYVKSFHPQII